MPLTLEQAIGQQFLLSFVGKQKPTEDVLSALRQQRVGGIVLFRAKNMGSLAELRGLTASLQAAAEQNGQPPLLIAADQEGGQLMAIGDGTPFPGNLALGATRSEKLAQRVGRALAREVAAVGVNVNFAPVCDVNNNPDNPVVGTRSFGEDPALVARLAAALVRGIQSAGVAATAKHFPGHGDTASDSHHAAPVIPHGLDRLSRIELPPFKAAIAAGVRLVMTAHIVLPRLNEGRDLPATLSPAILKGLLRRRLRFGGVVISDAMDMKAIDQGSGLIVDALAASAAGVDAMIFNLEPPQQVAAFSALVQAARRGLLPTKDVQESARRVLRLKSWLKARKRPPLEVVGCKEHRALARDVAQASVTLVRDRASRLPIRLSAEDRIAVVVPRPEDLTPADTSSYLVPALASAIGRHHPRVDEFFVSMNPSPSDVRALCGTLGAYDLVVVGTINATAHPGQGTLVKEAVKQGTPVVAVALRMPYDLAAYPEVATYACAYSILPPSMDAMADALFGKIEFAGKLPVSLPKNLLGERRG
jgi:beta-N-acetylhexosaminidase